MTHRCQKVLVVDRNADLQAGLSNALGEEGVSVLSVSRSDLALQVLAEGFRPDAILIDFGEEDIASAELLRVVKSSCPVPVIAFSPEGVLCRIGPAPDRELHKPFQVRVLLAVLDELCSAPHSPVGHSR